MKSPFTGGNVILKQEDSELVFRKEKFQYVYLYYECEDTKEHFTTTEIDEVNLAQVYNQYRIKYGIPSPDEIRQIRIAYGLTAAKMSKILGFGDNQYRLYENGDMPSESNGKILGSIKDPSFFLKFVENARGQFEDSEYDLILSRLTKVIAEQETPNAQENLIFGSYHRGICNGYAAQSYEKLKNTILFFIKGCEEVYNTKMNKLLFYVDFFAFKEHAQAITGLGYKAIQYGPVPVRWDRVYSLIDGVEQEIVEFPSGIFGTRLNTSLMPDYSVFSENEVLILKKVLEKFKDVSAVAISDLSHKEDAWIKYSGTHEMINFKEAFTLRAL
jgi:uncharacterized phage-associated protein